MDVKVNPDLLPIMLLYSLPPSFKNFRCGIESPYELPTPEFLRVKILEKADARKSDTHFNSSDAMIARRHFYKRYNKYSKGGGTETKNKQPFKWKCHRCQKIGHKAVDCTEVVINNRSDVNNAESISFYVNEEKIQQAFVGTSMKVCGEWCLDSGCTSYLCKNKENFVKIAETRNQKLNLASDKSVNIKGKRTVSISTMRSMFRIFVQSYCLLRESLIENMM